MRLSRDMDLFVLELGDATCTEMQDLELRQVDYGTRISRLPRHPGFQHLPLAQYKIEYHSALGRTGTIKLDLLYDPRIRTVPDRAPARL